MEFDRWTVLLLRRRTDRPSLDAAAEDALQDAHLAFLARLHEEGHLLAAGPVEGPLDPSIAGICIYRAGLEGARTLAQEDPAVKAGVFRVDAFSWHVPGKTLRFAPAPFPRSMKDAGPP
jgi:uncharacterized protein YciI